MQARCEGRERMGRALGIRNIDIHRDLDGERPRDQPLQWPKLKPLES